MKQKTKPQESLAELQKDIYATKGFDDIMPLVEKYLDSQRSQLLEQVRGLIKKESQEVYGKGSEIGIYHEGQIDLGKRLLFELSKLKDKQ